MVILFFHDASIFLIEHIHIHTHTNTYTHIHTQAHKYTNTQTHARIHSLKLSLHIVYHNKHL